MEQTDKKNGRNEIIEDYRKHRMEHLVRIFPENVEAFGGIRTNSRCAALTFDCCYECDKKETLKKLLFLKMHGIHSTFFITGIFISHCLSVVRIIHMLGFEVMNHSVSHKSFLDLNPDEQKREILDNAEEIRKITGIFPNLFRFPFGDYGIRSIRLLKSMDMIPVQWRVDTIDWMHERTDEQIYKAITEYTVPGSIILCHLAGNGFDGVRKAVLELKKQGYRFVTVNTLLQMEKERK